MSKPNMKELFDAVCQQSEATQTKIADHINQILVQETEPRYQPTAEQLAQLDKAIASADAGNFMSDEEVKAFWAKHGL